MINNDNNNNNNNNDDKTRQNIIHNYKALRVYYG